MHDNHGPFHKLTTLLQAARCAPVCVMGPLQQRLSQTAAGDLQCSPVSLAGTMSAFA